MMKFQRFAFILLSIMLVLAACSKSEDKPEKRQRPAAAKVVDLGEDNHEEKDEPAADEVKKAANRQRPAISSKKAPSRGRNAERQAEKRDDDNKKDDAPKDEPKPAHAFSTRPIMLPALGLMALRKGSPAPSTSMAAAKISFGSSSPFCSYLCKRLQAAVFKPEKERLRLPSRRAGEGSVIALSR